MNSERPICELSLKPVADVDVEECLKFCTSEQIKRCLDRLIEHEKEAKDE